MGGLGQRGQKKAIDSASELFRKTEQTREEQSSGSGEDNYSFTQNNKTGSEQNKESAFAQHPVRKQYVLSWELSERLRTYCFRERRKEVDVVREALAEYFERHDA